MQWAAVRRLSTMCAAICLRIGDIGSRRSPGITSAAGCPPPLASVGAGPPVGDSMWRGRSVGAVDSAGFGLAADSISATRSRLRIRPPIPVPWTLERSMPCSSAMRLTTGEWKPERSVSPSWPGSARGGSSRCSSG